MKQVSCLVVVAFVVLGLSSVLPAAAGCGERCSWTTGECGDPGNPWDGCYQSGQVCYDLPNCGWQLAARDQDQILEAAKAGNYEKVAEIAKKAGGLFRVTVKKDNGEVATVYDGWALAGLPAPGADGNATQLASNRGACDIDLTAPAETAAETAAAVAPQE